jgi:hypothetical protein
MYACASLLGPTNAKNKVCSPFCSERLSMENVVQLAALPTKDEVLF